MSGGVKDKDGKPIHENDLVSGKVRGGRHVGHVQDVVVTKEEAKEHGVKNPPKVILKDQHGHIVSRNPDSLKHGDQ